MVLVVVASLRCVRAQRRAPSGCKDVPLGKLESLQLRLTQASCNTNYNNYRNDCCACTFAVCIPLRRPYSSLLLQHQSLLQGLAAATSKADTRPLEPSLRVGWCRDASGWETRAASSPQSSTSPIHGARRGLSAVRKMAVPDKVALGLFFFWWHGSSVRATPSSYPACPCCCTVC